VKMANDPNMIGVMVIYVLFVLLNRQCAANISMHKYIGAANHLASIFWCCLHQENLRNMILGIACLQFLAYCMN
jgi:hypothetical protein